MVNSYNNKNKKHKFSIKINIVWIPNLPQPVKGKEGGASLSLSSKRDRGVW